MTTVISQDSTLRQISFQGGGRRTQVAGELIGARKGIAEIIQSWS
jgi:hypothetical protein